MFNFVFSAAILDFWLPVSSDSVSDGPIEKFTPKNIGVDTRIVFLSRRIAELLRGGKVGGNFTTPPRSALQNSVRCPRVKWLASLDMTQVTRDSTSLTRDSTQVSAPQDSGLESGLGLSDSATALPFNVEYETRFLINERSFINKKSPHIQT